MPETISTANAKPAWHPVFAWASFALALLLLPILLARYSAATSPTFDEGEHMAAGYRYWQCGDYAINPEHPPLLKLIAAFPIRHWQLEIFDGPCGSAPVANVRLIAIGHRLLNSSVGHAALHRARLAAMSFTLLLLVTVFFAARAWFGDLAAGIAVLLALFEPNLAGHGALVTTDVAIAATTFLTVFLADRYLRKPSAPRLVLVGFALGLALASKHTGAFVPFILLLQFAAWAWFDRDSHSRRRIVRFAGAWIGACCIGVFVLWATYQFRYSALPGRAAGFDIAQVLKEDGRSSSFFGHTVATIARFHLLPESYLDGLLFVVDNSVRTSFIFGAEHPTGVWYYFPVTMLVKTPLSLLFLFLLAIASPGLWNTRPREFTILALPLAVFLLSAMASKINIGVRHILPVYPFLILIASAAAAYYAQRSKPLLGVMAALLAFQCVSYARAFPNLISYANEAWGGPSKVRLVLGDSSVDWGQSLYQVRGYVAARGIHDCWIAWLGGEDPVHAGLPCRELPSPSFLEAAERELPEVMPEKFSGTIFVSSTLTNYSLFPYGYFRRHPPDEVIAGSVLVFHGSFDLPEIAAERHISRGWWYLNHQQPANAVDEFAAAEPHAAFPGLLNGLYGWALEATGKPAEASAKYARVVEDYAGMPAYETGRKAALARVQALRQAK